MSDHYDVWYWPVTNELYVIALRDYISHDKMLAMDYFSDVPFIWIGHL